MGQLHITNHWFANRDTDIPKAFKELEQEIEKLKAPELFIPLQVLLNTIAKFVEENYDEKQTRH